ncbi:hypothetical protein VUR80DRAFT_3955 [Thermomyces stellatus]
MGSAGGISARVTACIMPGGGRLLSCTFFFVLIQTHPHWGLVSGTVWRSRRRVTHDFSIRLRFVFPGRRIEYPVQTDSAPDPEFISLASFLPKASGLVRLLSRRPLRRTELRTRRVPPLLSQVQWRAPSPKKAYTPDQR